MKFEETIINGLFIATPDKIEDQRGSFARLFCKNTFKQIGFDAEIVQINHSFNTKKATFRGFHLQMPPAAEIKIIRCLRGKVLDFAIDLRKNSPTFLQHFSLELSAEVPQLFIIPKGCAHGFQTLENNSELLYFHTEFYNPNYESGISVFDPILNIRLPLEISEISEKDKNRVFLKPDFEGLNFKTN